MTQRLKAFLKGLDLVRTNKLSVNVKVCLALSCGLELLETTVLVHPVSAKDCCAIHIAVYRAQRESLLAPGALSVVGVAGHRVSQEGRDAPVKPASPSPPMHIIIEHNYFLSIKAVGTLVVVMIESL